MAEISLRQYLKTVDQHVQNGRYEEAIAHSRRILEYFPRLAAAYRLLGLALVGQARWDEAGEVFRRLLSATPDDFIAHQQLSLIYEKLKQPQESLWHLERALDLQPNDQQSVARLRELYSKQRGAPLERVPMTTAALAGQYLNNGLTDQAIEVLQAAIGRMPERLDLKMMLARAQWQSGMHVEAGETAIEVLQTMPYTLAANRIMTELWLEVQRPADAQRFLSRVEEVDPYLAMRLATNEPPVAEAFKLPELDYQQHVRQTLTQQSPDWLENLTQTPEDEQPVDLLAELGDDWMNEIDPVAPVNTPNRVTDNLPDLLDELPDSDSLSGLSPELIARIDAMRGIAADSTSIAPLPELPKKKPPITSGLTGMLDMNFNEVEPEPEEEPEPDDSWLEELARNDDFTIEASDVSATNDDWLANLERSAGTSGDRVPTGLTGQLGEFDADDAIEDLDAMLNTLENVSPADANAPRVSTGLTGMLDAMSRDEADGEPSMEDAFTAEPRTSTKPRRPNGAETDVDTDNLDWVQEFDPDMAVRNTSPLNPDLLPASDAQDSLAWLQNSGIEIDPHAPARANPGLLEDTQGDENLDDNANPNAWMDALGVEYTRTDELMAAQAEAQSPEDDEEEDALAWAKNLDLVSTAPTSALPATELPPPMPGADTSDALDWMSDESLLAEYEEFESLQGDEEEDDPLSTARLDDARTRDDGYNTDDNYDDFVLPDDFDDDELTEDELVENADLYAEMLDLADAEDENPIPDEYRASALSNHSESEGQAAMQTPSWQPTDPDDPDQPSMSDDLEWLSTDSLDDELLGDDAYIPDPDADEPITDLDSFFGGPMADATGEAALESAEAGDDAAWLNDLDLESSEDTPTDDTIEPEFDWSIGSATDAPVSDTGWLSDLGTASVENNADDEGFDWNSGFGDEAALTTDEPDWLADIQDPNAAPALSLDAEGTDDSAEPADASWLAELELEDAADSEAAEADVPLMWQPESGFDLDADEGQEADEADELDWLPQASDNVITDFNDLSTEEDAWSANEEVDAEPAGEAWLADMGLAEDDGAWADEEADAEPAGEAWLAELDAPQEDEPVAQPLSTAEAGGWLDTDDTGLDWEMLDDAEPSPTAGMTGLLNNIESQRYSPDMLGALDTNSDEPSWLGAVDETDNSTLQDAETPEWMQNLDAAEEPLAAGIDWTADNFADDDNGDDLDTEFTPIEQSETFDWENPAFAAEQDADQLAFGELDEDEFAYEDDEAAFDADALTDEPAFEGEQAAWLTGIGQSTDGTWVETEATDEPAWLSDVNADEDAEPVSDEEGFDEFEPTEDDNLFGELEDDEAALPVAETGYFTGTADENFDFMDDNALEDDEAALPVAETGYFTGTADENFEYEPDEAAWLGADDAERLPDEEFAWMADAQDADESLTPVTIEGLDPEPIGYYTEAQLTDAASVADDVTDDDLREYDFDEELEATPAANAPDWLNSMVPGLDLDFEAEEEADESAAPAAAVPASPTRRKEFDWLETIVTQETQQRVTAAAAPPLPASLPGTPAAPGLAERMRRFVFRDVPTWMRGGTPAATVTQTAAPVAPAPQGMSDFDRDFNAEMDDDLFDDMDAEFDDYDGNIKK